MRSSSTIHQDTASTARWWTITTSWLDEVTHTALSITPAAGFNRDRALVSASSEYTSTDCRHLRASTDPGSGTCNDQPSAPSTSTSTSTRSRSIGMAIQHGLQQHQHVGLGDPRRGLHQHRLVELLNLATCALQVLQPTHDRRRDHRPGALVHRTARTAGHRDHPRQPGHGFLDENVARPTRQPGGAGTGRYLHRQDAVATQLEE